MCSVSFIPRREGFYLAMNRDEQRARPRGLPPRVQAGGRALHPSEPGGGTWIGVNTDGLALALINWYAQSFDPGPERASRGVLIPRLLACAGLEEVEEAWENTGYGHCGPFRLLAFSPRERGVREWRWCGKKLEGLDFPWKAAHWFSSGHDEPAAQAVRQRAAENAWKEPGAGTLPWLRALHASHRPKQGALSFCMHREDACTVSATESVVGASAVRMRYRDGSPCGRGPWVSAVLPLASEVFEKDVRNRNGLRLINRKTTTGFPKTKKENI